MKGRNFQKEVKKGKRITLKWNKKGSVLADPRGTMRDNPYTNLDFRLEKSFALGEYGKLNFYIDVFNIAGRSDLSINSDPFAELEYFTTPPTYTLSSTYGQITSVSGVRSFRLGLRWTF